MLEKVNRYSKNISLKNIFRNFYKKRKKTNFFLWIIFNMFCGSDIKLFKNNYLTNTVNILLIKPFCRAFKQSNHTFIASAKTSTHRIAPIVKSSWKSKT